MYTTDYLVIGSGIAGLTFAVKIAEEFPEKNVIIMTKANSEESNTKYAQGGIAVVLKTKNDSFKKHITDTLIAGDGMCNQRVVEMVVKKGPKLLNDLINWGAHFDYNANGSLSLGKEGGHSEHRVVHSKDVTGYEVECALLKRISQLKNITLLTHHFAIDLITNHHVSDFNLKQTTCFGAYVLNQETNEVVTVKANHTLLATGGMGRVYGKTTNPAIATGDGIAMAYRAKAQINDMAFVQFHPTAMYQENGASLFLISEAVRGFGAYLRDKSGYRFMPDYDNRAELASRDIVSQSIESELKKSGDKCVFLDCSHLDIEAFKTHFPNIYKKCLDNNIDLKTDWIPVIPAAHYLCGGIVVNQNGQTTVDNLFACGECSKTGLHGANRLASNSLLEALVYADNVYGYLKANDHYQTILNIPEWNDLGTDAFNNDDIISKYTSELQQLMCDYAGIVRSNSRLNEASITLCSIYNDIEALYKSTKVSVALCELRNMINVAHLIISQSLMQTENRGGYFNTDYTRIRPFV